MISNHRSENQILWIFWSEIQQKIYQLLIVNLIVSVQNSPHFTNQWLLNGQRMKWCHMSTKTYWIGVAANKPANLSADFWPSFIKRCTARADYNLIEVRTDNGFFQNSVDRLAYDKGNQIKPINFTSHKEQNTDNIIFKLCIVYIYYGHTMLVMYDYVQIMNGHLLMHENYIYCA